MAGPGFRQWVSLKLTLTPRPSRPLKPDVPANRQRDGRPEPSNQMAGVCDVKNECREDSSERHHEEVKTARHFHAINSAALSSNSLTIFSTLQLTHYPVLVQLTMLPTHAYHSGFG